MTKKFYFIIMTAVLLLAVAGWYYIRQRTVVPTPTVSQTAAPVVPLGRQLLEKAQNPVKGAIPTTNPFKQAETNPFINVYKNPFAQ